MNKTTVKPDPSLTDIGETGPRFRTIYIEIGQKVENLKITETDLE